jgi:hypothetical protein
MQELLRTAQIIDTRVSQSGLDRASDLAAKQQKQGSRYQQLFGLPVISSNICA